MKEVKKKRDFSGMKKNPFANSGRPKTKRKKYTRSRTLSEGEKARRKDIKENPVKVYVRNKQPLKRTIANVPYDFLKYSYITYRWARQNYTDINRKEVDIMLFLYTEGAFSQRLFSIHWKPLGLYPVSARKQLIEKGYINLFRPRTTKQKALYILSSKGKLFCSRMHRFAMGLDKVPVDPRFNNMSKPDAIKADTYFIDLIKRMNKKKPPQ